MTIRSALTVVAISVVATLGWIYGRPLLERPLAAEEAAPRFAAATEARDTVRLGKLIRRQCKGVTLAERQQCYEAFFLDLSASGGVPMALGALAVLGGLDPWVEANGHVYTHLIGIRAWQPGRDVAKVFASCNGLYQSGCYHGVIQSYLTAEGAVDSARVAGLCDAVAKEAPGFLARFQCVHGLGHGLEMAFAMDLPRALEGCDWLGNTWDREACYGGAFMENAVASSPEGHHAPAELIAERDGQGADAGDHSGHGAHGGHGAAATVATFRMRDSADPLYPCSIMGDRYLSSCYQLQGGIILDHTGYDWAASAAICDTAPQWIRHECYLSLGTNASGFTVQDTERTIRMCSAGDPGYQPWCFVGAAKNYVDVTGRPEDGIAFCRKVPPGNNQRQCWVAVGEELVVIHTDDAAVRERYCSGLPEAAREDCRYGARLRQAPEGLPLIPGVP